MSEPESPSDIRARLHEIIFEADTPLGKAFDVVLLAGILLSVLVVTLESVDEIDAKLHETFLVAEWVLTILFTIEYGLRLYCVRRTLRYAFSFFGIVDLLAILPSYVSLFIPGAHAMIVIRGLRLLRVFRVFKLARFLSEATSLQRAIWASRAKIVVFLMAVFIVVVIMSSAMHIVEGREEGAFDSIPKCMYWAIVTMTTVGYGDVTPVTPLGKTVAAMIMLLGYSFLIVPTGIISSEMARASRSTVSTQSCPECGREGHAIEATHCMYCGTRL